MRSLPVLALALFASAPALAQDAYLLISGGGARGVEIRRAGEVGYRPATDRELALRVGDCVRVGSQATATIDYVTARRVDLRRGDAACVERPPSGETGILDRLFVIINGLAGERGLMAASFAGRLRGGLDPDSLDAAGAPPTWLFTSGEVAGRSVPVYWPRGADARATRSPGCGSGPEAALPVSEPNRSRRIATVDVGPVEPGAEYGLRLRRPDGALLSEACLVGAEGPAPDEVARALLDERGRASSGDEDPGVIDDLLVAAALVERGLHVDAVARLVDTAPRSLSGMRWNAVQAVLSGDVAPDGE